MSRYTTIILICAMAARSAGSGEANRVKERKADVQAFLLDFVEGFDKRTFENEAMFELYLTKFFSRVLRLDTAEAKKYIRDYLIEDRYRDFFMSQYKNRGKGELKYSFLKDQFVFDVVACDNQEFDSILLEYYGITPEEEGMSYRKSIEEIVMKFFNVKQSMKDHRVGLDLNIRQKETQFEVTYSLDKKPLDGAEFKAFFVERTRNGKKYWLPVGNGVSKTY